MVKRSTRIASQYHHGDLKSAVLLAAEKILERDGLQAVTLRAVARAVGVSHTAPKNHFGDLMGLLSELAAVGYLRFAGAIGEAIDSTPVDARDRLRAMGSAYVAFARAHPKLFLLMFHSERLT
ncbi:MAG: TetR/AcrR family transcriptional regulator [Bradyrhizobium sp.]